MTEPFGDLLRRAREARELSLEKISQETRIRLHYLEAIERGDLSALPSPAQARGFVKTYARYLNLDPDQLRVDAGAEVDPDEAPARSGAKPADPAVSGPAAEIFAALGQDLRQQRELLGFSLEDIERQTHVRTHYLEALENGQVTRLPSSVQGRGMLSNYAAFLGLDVDAYLLRFAEGLQSQLVARQQRQTQPAARRRGALPRQLRWLVSGDLVFGGMIVLLLAVFLIWGAARVSSMRAQEVAEPTAPSIAQVLRVTDTPVSAIPSPTPSPPAPTDAQTGQIAEVTEAVVAEIPEGAVQVQIVVEQRAWMRVLVDGRTAFDGRVVPGSAYPFAGDESVEILTGNGAAMHVYYNQQDLGTLGIYGEIVDRIFTVEGILTPTPSPTPTATASPRVTPSATPTLAGTPAPEG